MNLSEQLKVDRPSISSYETVEQQREGAGVPVIERVRYEPVEVDDLTALFAQSDAVENLI